MRFKIDENLPLSFGLLLEENRLDFKMVHNEGLSGKPDEMVMEACRREGLVLITMDVGFANQKVYPAGDHPGVIVLRLKYQAVSNVISAMARFLTKQVDIEDLSGCTVIVEDHRFRVRRKT